MLNQEGGMLMETPKGILKIPPPVVVYLRVNEKNN
jgi:hypothetical protein